MNQLHRSPHALAVGHVTRDDWTRNSANYLWAKWQRKRRSFRDFEPLRQGVLPAFIAYFWMLEHGLE